MSGSVELVLIVDKIEQDRSDKVEGTVVEVKNRKSDVKEMNGQAKSVVDDEAREVEASAECGNGDVVLDCSCSGSGPSVGIIFNYWSAVTVTSTLKRINKDIKITLARSSLSEMTEDEKRILQSLEILVVQPSAVGNSNLIHHLPNLKWMHTFTAGVEQLLHTNDMQKLSPPSSPPSYILTRNVGCFDRQMADYVVTQIIVRERLFQEFWENQTKKIWTQRYGRSLSNLTLGIIGFGNIGKEVARVAKFFGIKIMALVRSFPTEATICSDVDEYRLSSDIGDIFSTCDYVVSILPSAPSTNGFFDGDTLSLGKTKKPVFMNIGRGNVVRNSTILHALSEGWISHAILDVFEVEPLPVDSPLWTHPQVTVTPHTSATGFKDETFLKSFLENYERYINERPLLHTVDWTKGY